MKDNKGFTLVELLAVITILSLILMVVVPNVLKSYRDGKSNLYNTMIKNICRASNIYFEEYQEGLVTEDESFCEKNGTSETCNIRIEKLMNEKYLDEDLENPLTLESITRSSVQIIVSTNTANPAQIDSNGNSIYTFRVIIDDDENICNQ